MPHRDIRLSDIRPSPILIALLRWRLLFASPRRKNRKASRDNSHLFSGHAEAPELLLQTFASCMPEMWRIAVMRVSSSHLDELSASAPFQSGKNGRTMSDAEWLEFALTESSSELYAIGKILQEISSIALSHLAKMLHILRLVDCEVPGLPS